MTTHPHYQELLREVVWEHIEGYSLSHMDTAGMAVAAQVLCDLLADLPDEPLWTGGGEPVDLRDLVEQFATERGIEHRAGSAVQGHGATPAAVTEGMVEAGARAMWEDRYLEFPWGAMEPVLREDARVVLAAALGVQDPSIEDVLGGRFVVRAIETKDGQWHVIVRDIEGEYDEIHFGTGPTIDAAIRDAVRRATERGDDA